MNVIARVLSASLKGIDAFLVEVEVDTSNALPSFEVVGLPDSAVKESKERVRAALKNNGIRINKKITVNLAPGNVKKEGPGFDLPISVGILAAEGLIPIENLQGILMAGELSLDGSLNPIKGVLSIVDESKRLGLKSCIIPYANKSEGSLIRGIDVIAAKSLKEVKDHLNGVRLLKPLKTGNHHNFKLQDNPQPDLDFSDVKGQERVKRALTIAAAGAHNILLIGLPGVGKTMLARRLPTILPPLSFDESIVVTKIYSLRSLLKERDGLISTRPFRQTHHTISHNALVGGGSPAMPGEISLAHHGILFLDEIAEFSKATLETLRQPMEDKDITLSRVSGTVTYPSNFMLVAASNPCPCGYLGTDKCHCTESEIFRYMSKLSGPLLDRIDLHIELSPLSYGDLSNEEHTETSAQLAEKVMRAREIQQERFKGTNLEFNAHMEATHVEKHCVIDKEAKELLKDAFDAFGLSGRAYHRILKVARTIADIEGHERISAVNLMEALHLRNLDRKAVF